MIDRAIIQSMGSYHVRPILTVTRQLADAVRNGIRSTDGLCEMPGGFPVFPQAPGCKTVNDIVVLGVMLIAAWAMRQQGRGATDWPEALQAWLDDCVGAFWKSGSADEIAGFARLAYLLEEVSQAVESSMLE